MVAAETEGPTGDAIVVPAHPQLAIPEWVPPAVVGPATEALHRIDAEHGGSLGITSTLRGEGRTTIAIACAIGAAYDLGLRTVLVDLDLANPRLGAVVGNPPAGQFGRFLRGECGVAECIHWHDARLGIISTGPDDESAAGHLTPAVWRGALNALGTVAEVVVADLPPLTPAGRGARLADSCDAVLMVVRAGTASIEQIRRAVRTLDEPPPVLLNRIGKPRKRR